MYLSGLGGLRQVRGQVALALRLIMVGSTRHGPRRPALGSRSNKLSVVYAVDVSDSIGMESVDKALEFVVQTAQKNSPEDGAGLVVFARDAAVELPPRPSFPFEALNSAPARDATDLAKSLALAAAMLPEENLGRICAGHRRHGNRRCTGTRSGRSASTQCGCRCATHFLSI